MNDTRQTRAGQKGIHHKGTKINTKPHEEDYFIHVLFVTLCVTFVPLW